MFRITEATNKMSLYSDCKDTQTVIDFVEELYSFEGDIPLLRSFATGMTAAENTNDDKAREAGNKILMEQKKISEGEFVQTEGSGTPTEQKMDRKSTI